MFVRRHRDDQRRLLESFCRKQRVVAIQVRLDTQQDVGLSRLSEHLVSIEPGWQCIHQIATNRVRSLGDKSQSSSDQIGKHRGECVKLRRARMLLGDIPEEYRPLFAINQAAGNRHARCTGRYRFKPDGNRNTLDLGDSLDHPGQRVDQLQRLNRLPGMEADQRIIGCHRQQTDLAPLLRELT